MTSTPHFSSFLFLSSLNLFFQFLRLVIKSFHQSFDRFSIFLSLLFLFFHFYLP
ncbi:hypothetical protein DFH28DRAFT_958399 [Melampsora americana]|nr:hypothetical protein DFH28DRAFT_958399 [Melampsora americana]